MKTILLFDPRFPDRKPLRLTVDDAIASAAVRSGVAAAASPADAGALTVGGQLDAGLLTEVVLQHGANNGALTRVVLPFSVILVAAGLGLAASIGAPLTGVIVTPPPKPTPTIAFANSTVMIAEGNSGTKIVSNTINVDRQGVTGVLTINLTYGGTATSGVDYAAGAVSLTLADGVSSGSFDLTINGDTTVEPDETIIITAALAGYAATASKTITIGNDDTAGATLTPYALSSEAQSVGATSAYSTATPNRMNRLDRLITRMKATGAWGKRTALYLLGDTEAQYQVNVANPGTYDLLKVGTPTYHARVGANGFASASYYDTNIGIAALNPNSISFGFRTDTATTSTSIPDMGCTDANGGVLLFGVGAGSRTNARVFAATVSGAATSGLYGAGFISATREDATTVRLVHNGIVIESAAAPSSAPAANLSIAIGKAKGTTSGSNRLISSAFVFQGLTAAQELDMCAAILDYEYSVKYGDVMLYPAGVGASTLNVDLCIYGCTLSGVIAAYHARRRGLTVALIGHRGCETVWDIGSMPTSGLDWIDVQTSNSPSGIFRDMLSWINTTIIPGSVNSGTQANMSPEPRYWSAAIRRMLDPARASGALIPGQNIPVYMSTGIASVSKTGAAITSMTTNDGRVINAKMFMGQDDVGEFAFMAGLPVITGREAVDGTPGEATNGFRAVASLPSDGTSNLTIDPYLTPGDAASGLLPDVVQMPALAAGARDLAQQSMNYRLTFTTDLSRMAPLDSTVPRNYSAARYERFGRMFAASTALGNTYPLSQMFKLDTLRDGALFDINNGDGNISSDVPQGGLYFGAAQNNTTQRDAVVNDINDYIRGLFYWLRYSGDSRIPASFLTSLAAYGYDALSHLDPGSNPTNKLFFPNRVYVREATWMLKNTGFVFNGNDLAAVDGTTPRSLKTISLINYRADVHALRCVNDGGVLKVQGGVQGGPGGGTDRRGPWPLECSVPDKANCTNFLTSTGPSMTKVAWSAARMEPSIGAAAESLAEVAYHAIQANIAVQDVDYGTDTTGVRGALLTNTDGKKLDLPQVN